MLNRYWVRSPSPASSLKPSGLTTAAQKRVRRHIERMASIGALRQVDFSLEADGSAVTAATVFLEHGSVVPGRWKRLRQVMLCRMVPRDHRTGGLRLAQVDRFVRHAGRDEQELTGLADHFMLERRAPAGQDGPLQHVDARFVPQVDVRIGASAWRDDHEVHREAACANRLSGDTYEVREPLEREHFAIRPHGLDLELEIVHGFDSAAGSAGQRKSGACENYVIPGLTGWILQATDRPDGSSPQ